jgi:hypothetical protein
MSETEHIYKTCENAAQKQEAQQHPGCSGKEDPTKEIYQESIWKC